jgi:hypothetical protein
MHDAGGSEGAPDNNAVSVLLRGVDAKGNEQTLGTSNSFIEALEQLVTPGVDILDALEEFQRVYAVKSLLTGAL